jgi:hypothetical protein
MTYWFIGAFKKTFKNCTSLDASIKFFILPPVPLFGDKGDFYPLLLAIVQFLMVPTNEREKGRFGLSMQTFSKDLNAV